MGLQAPESKKGLQKLERNTSQTAHLFHAFTILGKQANFEMCTFLADYGPFSPYKRAIKDCALPQILQENPNSCCNDLVRYNSQLWDTVTMKCLLLCILEHPSRGCISSQVIIFLGIIFLASNNLSRTTLFVLLSKVLRTLLHWQGYDIII